MIDETFIKVADNAPLMLWVTDKNNKFVYFNKNWLSFRGKSMEEEISFDWNTSVYPQDISRVKKKVSRSFEDRKPYKIEYRIKRYDNTFRWIIESGNPQFEEEVGFTGFIGTCMDIHNIKELEKRKTEFITAASHELNTPLTSLTVYLQLMEEYFIHNGPANFKALSLGAMQQLKKITSLINQLLDMNKIHSGYFSYNWSEFPFHDVVTQVVEKFRMLYPERCIKYEAGHDSYIYGDFERLTQVIENLLSNAVKYSAPDTEVVVELREKDSNIILEVSDNGIGIDPAFHNKIFERFFRMPGPKAQTYPGMGMGLYLTRKIIEKHHGKIYVESKRNEFTKFYFKLPLLKTN